jgi:acyl carrier protein
MNEPQANDIPAKLTRCFSAVFPELSVQQIASARLETVERWDSVAGVTLATAIEEEFGIELDSPALEQLVSFRSILDYLTGLNAARGLPPIETIEHA